MSYYPEPESHIRDKLKVELDLSSYATKKELKQATGVDTFNLVYKSDLIGLKAEVDKLDINKLVKGCVHYIFASLFFKSKREHILN